MAYAALVSVAETLSQTLKHHHYPFVLHEKPRFEALHEHVKFLRAFLEDFPQKANDFEGRIRDAATEAEDLIEYLLFEEIRSSSSTGGGGRDDLVLLMEVAAQIPVGFKRCVRKR
ncbi:UNVERIFIED_CONTAM: hypothetical protein Sradi_6162700 [Sesamum radiatum]|uniref:Uncharacterized protein n=1 Tax=Sesamum radiatum TaxID=300843 RepID=A0AAW2K8T8_SESRA